MDDMTSEELEKRLASLRAPTTSALDARIERMLRAAARGALSAKTPELAGGASDLRRLHAQERHSSLWRFFHRFHTPRETMPTQPKHRWFLIRAACIIAAMGLALAVVVWLRAGVGLIPSAYAEVVQAMNKSKEAAWTHIIQTTHGTATTEVWVSLHSYRRFEKSGRTVEAIDSVSGRISRYDPERNVLTFLPFRATETKARSPLEEELQRMEQLQKEGRGTVTKSEAVLEGKRYITYAVVVKDECAGQYLIDPATMRIARVNLSPKGSPQAEIIYRFDYPESGPEDVFALGVPRDARVVEGVARAPADLVRAAVEAKKRFSTTYYALIVETSAPAGKAQHLEEVNVVYKKSGAYRVESYPGRLLALGIGQEPKSKPDDFSGIAAWVKTQRPGCVTIYPVEWQQQATRYVRDRSANFKKESVPNMTDAAGVEWRMWGVLGSLMNALQVKDGIKEIASPSPELRGLEIAPIAGHSTSGWERIRCYLNPARDYAIEQVELTANYPEPDSSGKPEPRTTKIEIRKYAQTGQGQWYPALVCEEDPDRAGIRGDKRYFHIALDPSRDISDGLLNPENGPDR